MIDPILVVLIFFNQLVTAGIAISAFSLLLYALTFNLRNRVARSFAFILFCTTLVFSADVISSTMVDPALVEFWLRLQWVGIICLPASYFYSSDALLASTGKPSHGRRLWVIRLSILVTLIFLIIHIFWQNLLVGSLIQSLNAAPYLRRTPLTWVFGFYYVLMMAWSWVNYWRSFRHTSTRSSQRRMLYLMAGATAPALGSYPFLLFGASVAINHHYLFWMTVVMVNFLTSVLLIVMAYSVAFFGVDWPDRMVKGRLFRWLLRGPVTASVVLIITISVRRSGSQFGFSSTSIETILMLATILVMQYLISLFSPLLERWLFYREDYPTIRSLQDMEERVLTNSDLRQFLEAILAAACDRLRSTNGFIAAFTPDGLDMMIQIGNPQLTLQVSETLLSQVTQDDGQSKVYSYQDTWLFPLRGSNLEHTEGEDEYGDNTASSPLLGLMGIAHNPQNPQEETKNDPTLVLLIQRAAMALENQIVQQKLFNVIEELTPQIDWIQHLRAVSQYDGSHMLAIPTSLEQRTSSKFVKEALNHYWGGPKLTQSPLLELQVVQNAIQEGESPPNALRRVLTQAIEQVRPPGERRFTPEWMLYNILDMKFVEGRKVREIATRLAMSEADYYRKQRTAIEEVARVIMAMEHHVTDQAEVQSAVDHGTPTDSSQHSDQKEHDE